MANGVGGFLTKRAYRDPEMEALVDVATERRFNYAELNARANAMANAFRQRGVAKGDRVALLLLNGIEFVESFFGLAKLGAVVVPLNWRLVADELSYILKDSGAETLVYGCEFGEVVADLHDRGGEGSDIGTWLEVGDIDGRQPFSEPYESVLAAAPTAEADTDTRGEDLLFIMYTSGTTGMPKGVVHTHDTITWAIHTIGATVDQQMGDRYVVALPMYHVGALTPAINLIYSGCTGILLRQFDPKVMWQVIADEKATTTLAVPAMLNFMLMVPEFDQFDYSRLRWIMSGASPVPVSLIEKYADLGIEIHQVYGLTECGGPGCVIGTADAMTHIGSTGKAFYHTEVRVVNEDGSDVPPGQPGQVLLRARHNMKEYWNLPEATKETLRGGWLHTGDVALMDAEGFVTIHDRLKDLIISGGENVYPAEVENVILQHEGVAEVAVIGQPSEAWGESPFAAVVRKDETLTEAAVLQFCEGKLARYKLPKGVGFVDEIPRNPTGKPLKRILREQFPGPAKE